MKILSEGSQTKKWIVSGLAAAIALLCAFSVLESRDEDSLFGAIDRKSAGYYDEAITRAVTTYAVVRGINGVISVLQGTEIAASPAGIGLTLSVGEVLDPINDLVERFSWVMLVSSASLGIQRLLMDVGVWLGFRVLMTAAMLFILVGVWLRPSVSVRFTGIGYRLLAAALVIRFCIPAVALASERVYSLFLEQEYQQASQSIETINEKIQESPLLNNEPASPDETEGYWDRLKRTVVDNADAEKFRERIEQLKQRVAAYAEYVLDLIVVFVLQTIVIPILVLWLIIRAFGALFGPVRWIDRPVET